MLFASKVDEEDDGSHHLQRRLSHLWECWPAYTWWLELYTWRLSAFEVLPIDVLIVDDMECHPVLEHNVILIFRYMLES